MDFWLEDDESPQFNALSQHSSGKKEEGGKKNSGSVYLSQQLETPFECENCGGNESYHDNSTGMDVCTSCYTQSSQLSQLGHEYEDVVGLAARNAGGRIQQRRLTAKRGDTAVIRRKSQPLNELDRSVPLPDTAICLRGMKHVLLNCVEIAVNDLIALENDSSATPSSDDADADRIKKEDDDDYSLSYLSQERQPDEFSPGKNEELVSKRDQVKFAVEDTVKELWLSYLRAWADGAEYYGAKMPYVRFCFRDFFLDTTKSAKLVRHHLVHRAKQKLQNNNESGGGIKEEEDDDDYDEANDDSSAGVEEDTTVAPETLSSAAAAEDKHDAAVEIRSRDNASSRDDFYKTKPRLTAIQELVQKHTSKRRKGYREVALGTAPSMTMVAGLLWLALVKNKKTALITPVTCQEVSYWIGSGKLPLMAAYCRLLPDRLQKRLAPVAHFFKLNKPPSPPEISVMATNLCAACRLRIHPIALRNDDDDDSDTGHRQEQPESSVVTKTAATHVRFWSLHHLPSLFAQLVANAGLDQGVLDRTLVMAGFSLDPNNPRREKDERDTTAPKDETTTANTATSAHGRHPGLPDLPQVVQAGDLSTTEELLALIAISCQLDPTWRSWVFEIPEDSSSFVPWNEMQFRELCTSGPKLRTYLEFVDKIAFPGEGDHVVDSKGNLRTMLPQEYFDAQANSSSEKTTKADDNAIDSVVRPCSILAGAEPPNEVEVTNLTHRLKQKGGNTDVRKAWEDWVERGRVSRAKEPKPKKRRQINDLHQLIFLPRHDFSKVDRALSDWIPGNCPDLDQDRLIGFLSYSSNADPAAVRRSMFRVLHRRKL